MTTHANGTSITWVDGNGGNTGGRLLNSGGSNYTVQNVTITNAHWCLEYDYNNHSTVTFSGNTISNCDHGVSVGGNSTSTQTLTGAKYLRKHHP